MNLKPHTLVIVVIILALIGMIISIGTMPGFRDWLAGRVAVIGSTYTVTSTGYASSPYQTDATPCYTAAGTVVRPGVVAANFLPVGTLIKINEEPFTDRVFIVEDRTSKKYQNRLDIWFSSTSEALEHGVKTITLKVIGHGTPGQKLIVQSEGDAGQNGDKDSASLQEIEEQSFFERTALRVEAFSRVISRIIGANVNRFDVDCTQYITNEEAAQT